MHMVKAIDVRDLIAVCPQGRASFREMFNYAFHVQVCDCSAAFACYDVVHTLASVLQGDVIILRNQELCIVASVAEIINDLLGDCAVELEFKEASVGTAFARCALTVAVVNKNFHR